MSEARMLELVQGALRERGIVDEVEAVGQFYPRGQTGGMFLGGLAGSDVGSALGGIAETAVELAGSQAGKHAAERASGLPSPLLVAVSATAVYGFDAPTRHSPPRALVFRISRDTVRVKVHQRVNVRVVELIDDAGGARIQLEGNRLLVTHSGDVSKALRG
jgi:hypothetical protein